MQTIVIGNEKGGAGKSTIAVHIAMALLSAGAKVAIIDFDVRQRTFERFLENRQRYAAKTQTNLSMPQLFILDGAGEEAAIECIKNAQKSSDFIIIDTPGSNTEEARAALSMADTIITPMNDSFVDFDLLATIDENAISIEKPNFYANIIWEAKKQKAVKDKKSTHWFILRNRLSQLDAKNKRKVGDALISLSKRLGFNIAPGLCERVIYRELFPMGLTLFDANNKSLNIELSISNISARQELRDMIYAFGFEDASGELITL